MRPQASPLLLVAALFLVSLHALPAQANPFTGGAARGGSDTAVEDAGTTTAQSATQFEGFAEFGPPRTRFGVWLRRVQRNLTSTLATMLRNVQRGEADGAFWLILSLSFIYGVVHSLLPGHRKVLLFSYFMAQRSPPIMGVVAGTSLALVHASAAVIVVLSAYFLIQTSISAAVTRVGATVQIATAGLLLLTGVVLTYLKVRETLGHGHHHGDDHGDQDDHQDHLPESTGAGETGKSRRLLPVIIISGIVPCPGSSMILLFAVSLGVVTLGLIAVGAFAVGMALSLSTLSVATILVKEQITERLESPRGHALHHGIEVASALFMVAFGLFLLLPAVL